MIQNSISLNDKPSVAHLQSIDSFSSVRNNTNNTFPNERQSAANVAKALQVKFTAALVHEVRNPLSNINLAIEMLESTIKELDLKIYLDIIGRSSMRINDLMCDLLNYQKTEKTQLKKYSIHKLLDEVLRMTEDRATLKKITVRKEYASNDFKINLDRKKMFIGLTNIVVNAIEAMSPGKGELKVTTKLIRRKYVVQIEDNGCGISIENLKKIAKPYFSTKPGGLGIGLASTFTILSENHVSVKVESEEGKWTRFTLAFEDIGHQSTFKEDETDRINSSLYLNTKH